MVKSKDESLRSATIRADGGSDNPSPAMEQATEDSRLSAELALAADGWIDLQRPTNENEYLMAHLAKRYEDLLGAFTSANRSSAHIQHDMLKFLIKQVARVQADVFALKSIVLGRDKLALSRDWDYRDPLQAYSKWLSESARSSLQDTIARFSIPLDADSIGFGWYPAEERNGSWWRWSGPSLKSGIMIPNLFNKPVKMEARIRVLHKNALPEADFIRIDGHLVPYTLKLDVVDDLTGTVSFEVDLQNDSASFFMLEFKMARTISPKEIGRSDDGRLLGVCLSSLDIVSSS